MNKELIKRIDMMMCEKVPVDEEAERTQNFDLYILLQDCRAALLTQLAENESLRNQNTALDEKLAEISEKKYVPMTYDELSKFWDMDMKRRTACSLSNLQSEIIRRAGLEMQE